MHVFKGTECDILPDGRLDMADEVLAQVRSPRLVGADTMNFWIEGERKLLGEVLAKLDLLVINDEELRQLAEVHNIRRAAKIVRGLGPKRLVVKRGEYGAALFTPEGAFAIPGMPLEDVRDPTGAGDSFAGGFLGYLDAIRIRGGHDDASLRRAMAYGSVMASFCVEDFSLKRLISVTPRALEARAKELREFVSVEGPKARG